MKTKTEKIEQIMSITDDAETLKGIIRYLMRCIENDWSETLIYNKENNSLCYISNGEIIK